MKNLPVMLLSDRDAFWDGMRAQELRWKNLLPLVTLQMVTCMRPMLTKPEKGWWTAEKKFFLSHFGSAFEQKK